MAEICRNILPVGVVNVVTGSAESDKRLSENPGVDKLALTDHLETGTKVMQAAAGKITDVMLELWGKNANIVPTDSGRERAVDGPWHGIFDNQGRACASGSRLLLLECIADRFLDAFVEKTASMTVDPGTYPDTDLGPLVIQKQYVKMTRYLELGVDEGASVIYRGSVPDILPEGYYVLPTVYGDVTQKMRVACQKLFGPPLTVQERQRGHRHRQRNRVRAY